MSEMFLNIRIPTDNDGYVLLQCPRCGEYFKISLANYDDDTVLEHYCPACGIVSTNFLTEEVMALAQDMAKNVAVDIINGEMKKLENKFKNNKLISFKRGKALKKNPETPVRVGVDLLAQSEFRCCMRKAKVKSLLKMSGCFCPFCGVMNFEIK